MPQNHTFEERSSDGRHSTWWSLTTKRAALIFVHGFLGSTLASWRDFPRLLLADPVFAGYDLHFYGYDSALHFYGYDSAKAQAAASAGMLHAHLKKLIHNNPMHCAHISTAVYLNRPESFRYTDIIIAAHSLGAAVTRRALLRIWSLTNANMGCIKLALFGPAHAGARARKILNEVHSFGFGIPRILVRFWYPVLDDLEPGSEFMNRLKNDTEHALCTRTRHVCEHVWWHLVNSSESLP